MNTPRTEIHMHKLIMVALVAASAGSLYAQAPRPAGKSELPATDVTAVETKAFIDKLPKNAISDLPIRVADVGTGHIGVYGVFRPKSVKQDAVLHEVTTAEVYYMLEGTGTLVTGGTLKDERREPPTTTTVRGSRIDGGVSRKVVPGDVIIIPGRTPHWWSSLDGDIRYMIIRADPDGRIALKP
jgi:mannose-6-phosphate isomerase-like protein (cupin superfamily)